MVTPVGDSYSAASGATIYGGRSAVATFAWLVAHRAAVGLNAWRAIPGTGGSGTEFNEYCGSTFDPADGELITGGGGHTKPNNRLSKLRLKRDVPRWDVVMEATPFDHVVVGGPYDLPVGSANPQPTARHTRNMIIGDPRTGLIVLLGATNYYNPPSTNNDGTVAAIDPATGIVKPAGYFPPVPDGAGGVNGCGYIDEVGRLRGADGRTFDTVTKTWSVQTLTGNGLSTLKRYPVANAKNQYIFFFCWGDGWGNNSGVNAVKQVGTVQTKITFNPSAALTLFDTEMPIEAGMDFVDDGTEFGFFEFYSGCADINTHGPGRSMTFFRVYPNASAVWDIGVAPIGSGNSVPIPSQGGTQNRIRSLPWAKGLLLLPDQDGPAYFKSTHV